MGKLLLKIIYALGTYIGRVVDFIEMKTRNKLAVKKPAPTPAPKAVPITTSSGIYMLGAQHTTHVPKVKVKAKPKVKDPMSKYNFQNILVIHNHFSSGLDYMKKAHSQKMVVDHCAYMFLAIKELMEANTLIGELDNRDYKISAYKRYLSKLIPRLIINGVKKDELGKNVESISRQLSNFQFFMKDKFEDDWIDHVQRHMVKPVDEADTAPIKTDPSDLEKAINNLSTAVSTAKKVSK